MLHNDRAVGSPGQPQSRPGSGWSEARSLAGLMMMVVFPFTVLGALLVADHALQVGVDPAASNTPRPTPDELAFSADPPVIVADGEPSWPSEQGGAASAYPSLVVVVGRSADRQFSPNGDGIDDIHQVWVEFAAPALAAAVVFDQDGREVAVLGESTLTARPQFAWDGLAGDGDPAPDGAYTIEVEARSPASDGDGAVIEFKTQLDRRPPARFVSPNPGTAVSGDVGVAVAGTAGFQLRAVTILPDNRSADTMAAVASTSEGWWTASLGSARWPNGPLTIGAEVVWVDRFGSSHTESLPPVQVTVANRLTEPANILTTSDPRSFSPNGDGFEDDLAYQITVEGTVESVTATVLSSTGSTSAGVAVVASLEVEAEVPPGGGRRLVARWDGSDEDGLPVVPGRYDLVFTIIDHQGRPIITTIPTTVDPTPAPTLVTPTSGAILAGVVEVVAGATTPGSGDGYESLIFESSTVESSTVESSTVESSTVESSTVESETVALVRSGDGTWRAMVDTGPWPTTETGSGVDAGTELVVDAVWFDEFGARHHYRSEPVTVSVHNKPVARPDRLSTMIDQPIDLAAPGVLANDSHSAGWPVTAELVGATPVGRVELAPDGALRFEPPPGWSGRAEIPYRTVDDQGRFDQTIIEITVAGVNNQPVVSLLTPSVEPRIVVDHGDHIPTVLATAYDPDGDPITFSTSEVGELGLSMSTSWCELRSAQTGETGIGSEPGMYCWALIDGQALGPANSHTLTVEASDQWGAVGQAALTVEVQPEPVRITLTARHLDRDTGQLTVEVIVVEDRPDTGPGQVADGDLSRADVTASASSAETAHSADSNPPVADMICQAEETPGQADQLRLTCTAMIEPTDRAELTVTVSGGYFEGSETFTVAGSSEGGDQADPADGTGSDCPTITVDFGRLRSTVPGPTAPVTIDPACGVYRAILVSSDQHHGSSGQGEQRAERWWFEALDADGTVVYASDPTPDLADDQVRDELTIPVIDLTGATSVQAHHLGLDPDDPALTDPEAAAPNPQSIEAVLVLEPIATEAPAP